ncbi:MAG: hypothetical protein ACYTBJ_13475 [Planctomycetota bacterium]
MGGSSVFGCKEDARTGGDANGFDRKNRHGGGMYNFGGVPAGAGMQVIYLWKRGCERR